MNPVAPVPTAKAGVESPTRRAPSRLARVLNSSIGLKLVMAVTGVILSGFVLVHMVGNLKVFEGAEALNAYGRFLRVEPALLWAFRLVLLAAVLLHIGAWLKLFRRNMGARPRYYRVYNHKAADWASRTMLITGPLLLAFIIFHLLHLTTGTVHGSFVEGDVYHNVVAGLAVVPIGLIYVVGMVVLGFHLYHGVWSLFQTLGSAQEKEHTRARAFATGFTLVVAVGFAAVPLAVLSRVVRPAPAPASGTAPALAPAADWPGSAAAAPAGASPGGVVGD